VSSNINDIDDIDEEVVRAQNIDGIVEENAEFVSNVTGIGWRKNSHKSWKKVINQIGTVVEDEIHQGKNHTTITLKAGSEVIIDDIRGRINPQYRVRDINGKIWFVSADNVEFSFDKESELEIEAIYRGGVRVDGTDEEKDVIPKRYEMPLTTDEEIKQIKERDNNG